MHPIKHAQTHNINVQRVGWLVASWLTIGFVLAVLTASFTRRCHDAAEAMKTCDAKSRLKARQPWPSFKKELAMAEKRTKDRKLSYPRPVRFAFYKSHTLATGTATSAKQEAALKVAMQRKLRCMPSKSTADTREEFRVWTRAQCSTGAADTAQLQCSTVRIVLQPPVSKFSSDLEWKRRKRRIEGEKSLFRNIHHIGWVTNFEDPASSFCVWRTVANQDVAKDEDCYLEPEDHYLEPEDNWDCRGRRLSC
jgi:hypothetical protein